MNEQNVKITKQLYAYRGYASAYNVEISNLVNPELQVKDAESAIKNKLRNGLYELRVFKLVTTLVLEFSTIENDDETKYSTFIRTRKQKQLLMKIILLLLIYLNRFILRSYQT